MKNRSKPPAELIVMLTQDDVTIKNVRDVFLSSCDLEIKNWGFKNTGISNEDMSSLIKIIKDKGKTAVLEIVSYNEASCLNIVKKAAEYGIDQIMGTVYSASIHDFLDKNNILYKPFIGKVSGNPSILEGNSEEIINEAILLLERGVSGFDLLAYRYIESFTPSVFDARIKNAEDLARNFIKETDIQNARTCIAGGICTFEQIDFIFDISPWAFTMGTALFESKFAPNGSFRENLMAVLEYINKKQAKEI